MTQSKFIELCEKYTIHPSIALENDDIRDALRNKQDSKIETLLREEF